MLQFLKYHADEIVVYLGKTINVWVDIPACHRIHSEENERKGDNFFVNEIRAAHGNDGRFLNLMQQA